MAMTSYERVVAAFRRQEPDRVPIFELMIDPKVIDAILPGATFTEIERKTVTPAQKERIISMQCVPRAEVPEDLVGAVLFLASEASSFVTGQSINLDGGVTGS